MNLLLRSVDWKEAVLGLTLLTGLVISSFYHYLFFHTFAELFSIIIAYGVFMLAWNTRRILNNDYLLFVGISYFFVAFLDLLHTLAYKGMPIFIDYNDNNLPPQIWIVARYMESLSLLIAPIYFKRKLPIIPVFTGYAAMTALALFSIFTWRIFPDCFVDGYGLTPFKIVSEYVICAILAGASYMLWRFRDRFEPLVLRFLILSMAATIATELCFTAYENLYATINMVGHIFKILSFYFMYRALIETGLRNPYDLMFRDLQLEIDERKKAQEALTQSRELLQRTQKAGGVGGFELDCMTGAVSLTGEGCHILGAPDGSVTSLETLLQCVAGPDRELLAGACLRTGPAEEAMNLELRLMATDQEPRWVRFSGASELHEGRRVIAGVVQDVTDKIRLERLRDDIERMARHDLKSPLNAIIGFPSLILADENMSREVLEGYLGLIRQTGYKMLKLINISMDMFKMEQDRYAYDPKPVETLSLLERIGQESAGKLRARKLTLSMSVNGEPPCGVESFTVLGEELLCWSMLGNLLENAIEASPRGGVVIVRLTRENGVGRIAFCNKGTVPADVRPRFFEKYVTSGKTDGTGLGTYSARLIARTLDGSIELDTSDPEGTTVTVTLPMAD